MRVGAMSLVFAPRMGMRDEGLDEAREARNRGAPVLSTLSARVPSPSCLSSSARPRLSSVRLPSLSRRSKDERCGSGMPETPALSEGRRGRGEEENENEGQSAEGGSISAASLPLVSEDAGRGDAASFCSEEGRRGRRRGEDDEACPGIDPRRGLRTRTIASGGAGQKDRDVETKGSCSKEEKRTGGDTGDGEL